MLLSQRDERERIQLQKITDNTLAIRTGMESGKIGGTINVSSASQPSAAAIVPADANEILKQLTRTRKKVETMEEALQNRLSVVANEVRSSKNDFMSCSQTNLF